MRGSGRTLHDPDGVGKVCGKWLRRTFGRAGATAGRPPARPAALDEDDHADRDRRTHAGERHRERAEDGEHEIADEPAVDREHGLRLLASAVVRRRDPVSAGRARLEIEQRPAGIRADTVAGPACRAERHLLTARHGPHGDAEPGHLRDVVDASLERALVLMEDRVGARLLDVNFHVGPAPARASSCRWNCRSATPGIRPSPSSRRARSARRRDTSGAPAGVA